jgi:hypothetical protein
LFLFRGDFVRPVGTKLETELATQQRHLVTSLGDGSSFIAYRVLLRIAESIYLAKSATGRRVALAGCVEGRTTLPGWLNRASKGG